MEEEGGGSSALAICCCLLNGKGAAVCARVGVPASSLILVLFDLYIHVIFDNGQGRKVDVSHMPKARSECGTGRLLA